MNERTVLITGAAGGIGEALCNKFSEEGWWVIASDWARKGDVRAQSYLPLDLRRLCNDPEYTMERLEAVRAKIPGGRLDALINNAATQITAPFEELSDDDWKASMDTNLLAPALLIRKLIVELETAHGSVLNIASIHARLTKPGFTAYATSKAGLIGLTRALAVELGRRVRVNAICPAAISTAMLHKGLQNTEDMARLDAHHPSGRIGTPEEVAEGALYLVGSESTFLTGTILGLDGAIASRLHDPG